LNNYRLNNVTDSNNYHRFAIPEPIIKIKKSNLPTALFSMLWGTEKRTESLSILQQMKRLLYLLPFIVLAGCKPSNLLLTDTQLKTQLKKHIVTLSSDDFEGRETGTPGEEKAHKYIEKQYKKIGLKPAGEKNFLQDFDFTYGMEAGPSSQLVVNMTSYKKGEDFMPLSYSGDGVVTGYIARVGYGIADSALKHDDYKGKIKLAKKIFVINAGTPDDDPHGKFSDWMDMRKKIDLAIAKGAAAIIFIGADSTMPKLDSRHNPASENVPVLYAIGHAASALKDSVVINVTAGAEVIRLTRTGHNVIGFVNNNAPKTIIIGAHYDHLGYGSEGSLYRGEPAIHNGADDNASGTAALIQLASFVKAKKLNNSNYLFLAFSGEEKGLLGSNYYVKHPTTDLGKVDCMINMDMLGRLKPDEKTLIVNGVGTSPEWKTLVDKSKSDSLHIKYTDSGIGPSDHTSFYLKDIPVLHFFSGTHEDYHKPSDDEDKINYEGEIMIVRTIERLLAALDTTPKLPFTKTKDDENEDTPRFKVTLGVVPDYAFEGDGMRIDGVSDGKPASKAGLQAGDIVVQLGDYPVHDMMSYMKALGKFNKGDTTKVKVIRKHEEVVTDITF